jgi:hypothetical protein
MKKATFVFALLAFFVVAAYVGQAGAASAGQDDQHKKTAEKKPPLRYLNGKISDDGKSFTDDKDNKQWSLKNPEDVKGHEGHHVRLHAHVYKDTNELHVMKLTMIKEKGKKKGEEAKP